MDSERKRNKGHKTCEISRKKDNEKGEKEMINIQLFGGRGASSISNSSVGLNIISVTSNGTLGVSASELSRMSDDEYADLLDKSRSVDMPLFLSDWDSQRLIYNVGLNGQPTVVDDATFNQMVASNGSTVLYRTVNEFRDTSRGVTMHADEIQEQMLYGDLTRIGGGRMGDGFYFADTYNGSASYGYSSGNVRKTAIVKATIDQSKAKVISEGQLSSMYYSEIRSGSKLGKALNKSANNNTSWGNSMMEYALHKGYNVVKSTSGDGYYNVIDRSVLTMSKSISPI